MGDKNSQSRLNESSKTQASQASDRNSMLRQSILGTNEDGLATLRADLNRSLDEYRIGHYAGALETLQKVLSGLDLYRKSQATLADVVADKVSLLLAATQS